MYESMKQRKEKREIMFPGECSIKTERRESARANPIQALQQIGFRRGRLLISTSDTFISTLHVACTEELHHHALEAGALPIDTDHDAQILAAWKRTGNRPVCPILARQQMSKWWHLSKPE